ncbi:MAG: DUF1330 domain-containing protein [Syntrophomonadaceae bacterium]|nr:DUF1330 domain-containing protein [Syntrophomonadaceae bacterium]
MSSVEMNLDMFRELKNNPNDEKVVMLNLLKFKPDGGLKSYMKYMQESNRFVEGVGGKMIFLGKPKELLNGSEIWDLMMLVEYPSRQHFLKMANDPEYIKIHEYREKAVERAVLYAHDRIKFSDLLALSQKTESQT